MNMCPFVSPLLHFFKALFILKIKKAFFKANTMTFPKVVHEKKNQVLFHRIKTNNLLNLTVNDEPLMTHK